MTSLVLRTQSVRYFA